MIASWGRLVITTILIFSVVTAGAGESQTRPSVLQIAPTLDDSSRSPALLSNEKQDWLRNHPGDKKVGSTLLPPRLLEREERSLLAVDPAFVPEVEPNGTSATATPLSGARIRVQGYLFPNGDIDFYSFSATAGDRVYAAIMTAFSSGSSTDSQLTLLASDGTTVIEFDDDNGSFAGLSSSLAGATIPTTGTYFLKINDFTAGTTSERPYELYLRVQSGSPTPEVESNDTPATANPLPANGWVSGSRNPAAATEQDWYSVPLNAGDTVYLSLDVNPERDGTVWNGRLGFALFGDASNQILVVDDAGTGDVAPNPTIPSEAMFFTVKTAGTYFTFVDSASAAVGGPTATYNLSVSVYPAVNAGVNCTTYTSTDVPKTIGPGTGLVSSTITVPGNPRIADIDVSIVLNHALMQDVDAHLRSPAGNDNGLFTDIGAAATGGQTQMDLTFDDEAGIPPSFTALKGIQVKPENNSTAGTASTSGGYRLSWFDGENAGGTWTLDLRDDTAGANGGTLTSWSIRICEVPPPPACAPGFTPQMVFSTDFESGAAGFTHSGTQDEWELGLPATIATTTANPVAGFSTCNSGVSCWKTDLDNTYNASSNQDLLSPSINLAGLSAPVVVTWAQRHQIETPNFDHMFIDYQQVGGATPVRLYEWLDPTPISASAGTGNPQANIGGSVGWGVFSQRADSLAGLNTELRFHLDSDTTVNLGGLAIDDVSVTACRPLVADLAITKTDGVITAVPGEPGTYTITASNAGPDGVAGATVADTFPAVLTCTWTCVGAGGGTCTASGSGNINDTVNLPSGGSVTYTASCDIAALATGTLSNTATVSSSVTDPDPANNSATDTDTLTPQADPGITKTDGVTVVTPGGSVTYTIVASNPGPSDAPGATVADTFPAALTCTWTCVGAGGSTCTASGSGNINDTVNLPSGGVVTYTASCTINAAVSGTLANTATLSVPAGVSDSNPANNSATDTDTLLSRLTIDDVSRAEGNSGTTAFTFTVSLSAVSVTPVTVQYATANGTATAGSDYTAASGTVTFAPGQTSRPIVVNVLGDTVVEPPETFVVNLSSPSGATISDGQGGGTITNDDTAASLRISDMSRTEGNSGVTPFTFTVSLSAASAIPVTVQYATANGTATAGSDYTAASGTLTFSPGQTSQTVAVNVLGDTVLESNESFVVQLSNVVGASLVDDVGVGTILNDEGLVLRVTDVSMAEGSSGVTAYEFTVALNGAAKVGVSVEYETVAGSASAGSDYGARSGVLTFVPGQEQQRVVVPVVGDTVLEANETFVLNLRNAVGATIFDEQGVGLILNDEGPVLRISDVSRAEGDKGTSTFVFTVTLSTTSASPVTVNYGTVDGSAVAGSDYTRVVGVPVVFLPGQTNKAVVVNVVGDTRVEPTETFGVVLRNAVGATLFDGQASGTITNDDFYR